MIPQTQTITKLVLFVGDSPSPMNFNPNEAFVGTKSHEVLKKWIQIMNVTFSGLENSHTDRCLENIKTIHGYGALVVALGNNASKRLCKINIAHFKLPHPSPRNRKLNDHNFIASELEKCYYYLKGIN